MDSLTDWALSDDDRIRFYSGTASYKNRFTWQAADPSRRLLLDLGCVAAMARVRLNGRDVGRGVDLSVPAGRNRLRKRGRERSGNRGRQYLGQPSDRRQRVARRRTSDVVSAQSVDPVVAVADIRAAGPRTYRKRLLSINRKNVRTENIHLVYFSATYTTRKVMRQIAAQIEGRKTEYDITRSAPGAEVTMDDGDLLVVGMPVYSGRIPASALPALRKFRETGRLPSSYAFTATGITTMRCSN